MERNKFIDLDFSNGLRVDTALVAITSMLFFLGFVAVFSASKENAHVLGSHVTKSFLGLFVFILISRIKTVYFTQIAAKFYVVVLLLLVGVAIAGDTRMGATRWLDFGFFAFQPSELAKLSIPLMCSLIVFKYGLFDNPRNIGMALFVVSIPALFILKQPDLGTAIMVAASGFAVMLFAGFSMKLLAGAVVGGGLLSPLVWTYVFKPYQKKRIETVFSPESDPQGAGYHVIQSKAAIGSGGTSGSGWLNGTQTHLGFIPEQHTDFIFSAIAEEFGLVGTTIVFTLYFVLLLRLLYILVSVDSLFGKAFVSSVLFTVFAYVFVNIGMVVGILPVVGVPLPLVSYGGTATLTLMASLGIVSAFSQQNRAHS